MKSSSPILITGCFRSGTTLISRMLNNHPEIGILYDSVNFMRFCYNRYNPIHIEKNYMALVNELTNRIRKRWKLYLSEENILKSLSQNDVTYASIYDVIMNDLLVKNKTNGIWGEKTTLVWTKIPAFFEMFPTGRVILIIRDPRAVLASWKTMTNAPGNDYLDAIINCRDAMEKSLEFDKKYADNRYITLSFEELVTSPERTLRTLCEKLEIHFSKQMLDHSMFLDKEGNHWKGNSMFKKKVEGISKEMIDNWKERLDIWEIFVAEKITEQFFKNFGYKKEVINIEDEIIDRSTSNIMKSTLVTEGLIRYIISDRGSARFPSDPLVSSNWEENDAKK